MAISGSNHKISDREKVEKVLALIEACNDKPTIVTEIENLLR